jgi:hypothetical protein
LHNFFTLGNFYSLDTDCVLLVGTNQGRYFWQAFLVMKTPGNDFITKIIAWCGKFF